jgi:serine/threonine-protein kinase
MIAGQRLFTGATDGETLQNVLMRPIAEPSRRRDGVPAVLDAIVARALERDPAKRYESAEAFANELDRFLVEAPVADQAIPNLLAELASVPPPKPADLVGDPGATFTAPGSAETRSRPGTGANRIYRTIPPPKPPRIPLPTLLGIFFMVVAVVVTVGRVAIRHQMTGNQPGNQSSSAKSVSTSK